MDNEYGSLFWVNDNERTKWESSIKKLNEEEIEVYNTILKDRAEVKRRLRHYIDPNYFYNIFDAAFNVTLLEKYEREKEIFNNHNDAGKAMLIRKCLVPYMCSFFDKLTNGSLHIPDVREEQLNPSLLRMNFEIMENNIKSSLANFMKKIQSSQPITQFRTIERQATESELFNNETNQHNNIPDESLIIKKMTGPEQVYGLPNKELECSSKESCQTLPKQCDCKLDYCKQSKNKFVCDSANKDIKRLINKPGNILLDQELDLKQNLAKKETLSSKSSNSSTSGLKLIRICRTEPDCSYVETGGHNMPRHARNNHNNLLPEYDSRYVDSLVFEQMQRIWLEQQQRIQKKRFGKRKPNNQDYECRKCLVVAGKAFDGSESENLGKNSECD